MPTEEEVDILLKKMGTCLRPDPLPKDQRKCCFCRQHGDGQTDGPARLLNLDLDLWVSPSTVYLPVCFFVFFVTGTNWSVFCLCVRST